MWDGVAPFSHEHFPRGVQSGDPLQNSVRVWTWAAEVARLQLHVSVWDGSQWRSPVTYEVESGEAGYVHYDVPDLAPDEIFGFQFTDSMGNGSGIGQARAALDSDGTIRFGVISCTKGTYGPFGCLSALAAQPLDFCIYLGDTSYNDSADTLEEYREAWASTLGQQGYRDLQPTCASIATWDDHEVLNNWDRETVDPERLEASLQAFFEVLPIRRNENSEIGLWRSFRWGSTMELFVLDCRGERFPSRDEYLSREQLDWLKEGICQSSATWKVIANSVPITNMPPVFDVDIAIRDRWEGFEAQRTELLDELVACGISGVLFLGGDLHFSAFATVEPDGAAKNLLELIVGPTGNRANVLGALIPTSEQFPYAGADPCSAIVELTSRGEGSVELMDSGGDLLATGLFTITDGYTEVWSLTANGSG